MLLGTLIDELKRYPSDARVLMTGGEPPGHFDSWRGDYSHLTITEPSGPGVNMPVTVSEMLRRAEEAVYHTFTGYKGGEYVMSRDTPVWADSYGNVEHKAITGLVYSPEFKTLVIATAYIGDYR